MSRKDLDPDECICPISGHETDCPRYRSPDSLDTRKARAFDFCIEQDRLPELGAEGWWYFRGSSTAFKMPLDAIENAMPLFQSSTLKEGEK